MNADRALKNAEQQMLAARPWDAAEEWSIWSISGEYPGGRGAFSECLAVVLPHFTTGSDRPLFRFIGPLDECVEPAWITRATPLLLVHRDDPGVPYWERDSVWVERGAAS